MSQIINKIDVNNFTDFTKLFDTNEGRLGVAVTFLAILELLKDTMIDVVENEEFAPLHIKFPHQFMMKVKIILKI